MNKEYTSLGLMSGTSGDGVDASIIQSDGKTNYKVLKDKYFEYDIGIYNNIHYLREKINNSKDLLKYSEEINSLEKQITIFHAKAVQELIKLNKIEVIGFHGHTIFHNGEIKISKQLGDGLLLSQLTKKDIVFNFRQNDLRNGGEGAPLAPIFHKLIADQYNFNLPICILNIGGISNVSIIGETTNELGFFSKDIGPGNCMIDNWVRKNSDQKYDKDGYLAANGNKNEIILEQAQELFSNKNDHKSISYDVNDFDISFARGLSLQDGAATLTDLTAQIISSSLKTILSKIQNKFSRVLICGGGRKNKTLVSKIKDYSSSNLSIEPIDNKGVDGDFVESQAFGFLAIRSKLKLPISFPETTGCSKPSIGGDLIKY